VRVVTAAACLGHDPGPGHPESPARLRAVLRALAEAGIAVDEAPVAAIEDLVPLHPRSSLEAVQALAQAGGGALDADTHVSPRTWDAILGAAGACLAALAHALTTGGDAFAAVRPPGHHALADKAMGFCFVGHAALLAHHAHERGRERVLIVDWDVHHGNGTQALVEGDPRTRFVSMHQWPLYPGTGAAAERGRADNCWNVPMAAGLPRTRYVEALWDAISAATTDWVPDLILVSAGYDGMAGDPLGGFTLEPEDFAEWMHRLRALAPAAPIVVVMEGGYAPERLAAGVLATVNGEQ
jgi:acetoin utilization deacetylase AcuC-like enzyme